MHLKSWKLLPFFYIVCTCCCLPDGDLCRWMNGRKYYIDVGESGIISAENVTSQTKSASADQPQIPQRCSVELVTCPACHFRIYVTKISIPTCSSDDTCRCDFVWVKESAYSKSGQEFCGYSNSSSLIFESKTKQVSVDFLYTGPYESAFALHFSAIKNVYVYKGGYDFYKGNSTGVFGSPNFPGGYPSDYSAEYVLQNADSSGFVQLLFSDFQLSLWSYLEILDSNGSRIDVYNGNTFRPPAIISSGPTLTVKFQANEEYPSSGFFATYSFVGHTERYWLDRPSTECGGFVEDHGGAITMMNVMPGNVIRIFDCIWLIRPRSAADKQISVRLAQFEDMGSKSTLTIHQGLFSSAPILESVTPFQHQKVRRGQEYVVPANIGFYIRLIGYFMNKSHLAIVYSTFQYEDCFSVGDFECINGRCIKSTLRCDGFNHCGDGSDESACYGSSQGTQSPEDVNWWRTLTPNYYFPKSENGNGAGTNTLILITSLAGLGMFVLTTVVILMKLHKQRQDDMISREILQTISADINAENAAHQHHGASDPPRYDPPPTYDDAIKYYLPPPPAYSRKTPSRNCHSRSAIENDVQRPCGGRARGRRTKSPKQFPTLHEPAILQVALPEISRALQLSTTNQLCRSSSEVEPRRLSANRLTKQHSDIACMPQSSSETNTVDIERKSLESQQTKPVFQRGLSVLQHYKSILGFVMGDSACNCQGACSCSTQRNHHIKQLHNELSIDDDMSEDNNKPSRSRSFKDMDSSNEISGNSSLDITSQEQCTSIKDTTTEQDESDPSNFASHRRTSSDPSKTHSVNYMKNNNTNCDIQRTSEFRDETESMSSPRRSETCDSPVASGIDTRHKIEQHMLPEKDTVPSGWGSLWNQVRQKSETNDFTRSSDGTTWVSSDTQPLISKLLSKNIHIEAAVQQKCDSVRDII